MGINAISSLLAAQSPFNSRLGAENKTNGASRDGLPGSMSHGITTSLASAASLTASLPSIGSIPADRVISEKGDDSKYIAAVKSSFTIAMQMQHSQEGDLSNLLDAAGGVSATYLNANPTMNKTGIENMIKRYATGKQVDAANAELKKAEEQRRKEEEEISSTTGENSASAAGGAVPVGVASPASSSTGIAADTSSAPSSSGASSSAAVLEGSTASRADDSSQAQAAVTKAGGAASDSGGDVASVDVEA